jgi:hypothetical protein
MSGHSAVRLLICAVFALVVVWPAASSGNGKSLQSANTAPLAESVHPILVELFTSEGCSSCPPADEFVQKLDTLQPVPGAQLIVLSEHVDYWDHEGWKDPSSSHAMTERQGGYVHALGLDTAYTPQIIVDGDREMRISDAHQVENVFQQAVAAQKLPVRIGTVSIDQGNSGLLRTHVEADTNPDKHTADVYVAIALDHLESQVLHGENGGRHLTHVAVVQQITKVGKLEKGKAFAEDVQLKLKPGTGLNDIRVVAFVQTPGPGKLLGAAVWKASR